MVKARIASLLLAVVTATGSAAYAGPAPDERLSGARERLAAARTDFSTLLAHYRTATLAADEAVAESLDLRRRSEQMNVVLEAGRKAFQAGVARAYIDGPASVIEAMLHARDVADINALLPFAESSLALNIRDARALTVRRKILERVLGEVGRRQAVAVREERHASVVANAISERLAAASAAVSAAKAAVEAARAKAALTGLSDAWKATKTSVDLSLYQRRKARGEKLFRDSEPFLGPRSRCDAPSGLRPAGLTLSGKSSWYGAEFAGKGTASGAVYDPWRYTVAHRTLPFGLFLLIKSDGKCVMSLLNDRGPYIYDRILDLSAASAKAVDLSGVEHVDAVVFVRDE